MDYNVEMLRLYFKEKNFSKEDISKLLNSNPFNEDFVIWENQKLQSNKIFSNILKQNSFININTKIQEITIHENNSVGKYLQNDIDYIKCSINKNINSTKLRNNLVLIKELFPNEKQFLIKLSTHNIPFIAGVCSRNFDYYYKALTFYKNLAKEIKGSQLYEFQIKQNKTCILKRL